MAGIDAPDSCQDRDKMQYIIWVGVALTLQGTVVHLTSRSNVYLCDLVLLSWLEEIRPHSAKLGCCEDDRTP